jgi:hypothetical protein
MDEKGSRLPRRPEAPRLLTIAGPLPPEWAGWQLNGNYLTTPDGQKLHKRRVIGLAWREAMELRKAGYASRRAAERGTKSRQYGPRIKVIIISLDDYRVGGLAAG